MNIGVLGADGSGKTTLIYSLSKHLSKNKVPVKSYNFDVSVKHLPYPVDFDVRKKVKKKELEDGYSKLFFEKTKDVVFYDLGGGIDFFLQNKNLLKKFNLLLYVCEDYGEKTLDALQDLLVKAFNTPVFVVVNKIDLKKSFSTSVFESVPVRKRKIARVSAWEKTGLHALAKQLDVV
ncbi:MAG: ATP/GTP-binding protein [Candidatus Micrarchaeota archaeon]